ncbi:MAG: DEAD/DEAH box helicase family protein [Burkholderiales bacterium]|nr:DEAD/DEAH box helicase family protein [Burkholderiales bacterium]
MIALRDYQERVLDSLREFFKQCARDQRPEPAYQAVQLRYTNVPVPYLPVNVAGLPREMPYVCLRVPTGGGKTLLACHAAGMAIKSFKRAEHGVVLWLVPSNTILTQTADALRDPRHPYRRALELACGAVEVVTIEEALRLSRATVEGQTVVIVSTIQAFRTSDPTGRKVYDQNGIFAEHLLNLPSERIPDLLPGADGKPKPSLVNMLRLRRPVVIVDEAHNARTPLSFESLGDVQPSCIVEFTATPAMEGTPSNVLHRVSAAELKAADMVKLPLRVITRHPSQKDQLLADAIALRADLEKLASAEAQQTGEYLRPILLIQAERVDACAPLREQLVKDFNLAKEEIRISVGTLDELKDVKDIESPRCPVRFIITVQKLGEGWDCPFAYVLCSLRETRSVTAIEQIVGRILRLPGAKPKKHPDLNCAYALSVSDSLPEVLNELRDALVNNGFTPAEAGRIIIPVPATLPLGLQAQTTKIAPAEIDAAAASAQVAALGGKVKIDAAKGEITVVVPLDDNEAEKLVACVKTPEAKARIREVVEQVREADKAFGGTGKTRVPSPYERQLPFFVPILSIREDGDLFEFESTFLLEQPWKLSEKDASLSSDYNPLERPKGRAGEVDVGDKGRVQTKAFQETPQYFVSTVHQQSLQLEGGGQWTAEQLIAWLDRHIDHTDIPVGESAEFLRKVLRGLMAKFGIDDVQVLAMDRFRLRDEVERSIQKHRDAEREAAFKQFLLPGSALVVDDAKGIDFSKVIYEPSWLYEGGFQFERHYFGHKPGELKEKTPGGELTEEFKCAQFLDQLPGVKYWMRNLVRKTSSLRLQTSTDWFYPDFVCHLDDGRTLAVEYKGKQGYSADDAVEKRAVGAVWASRSGGRCLFVMPTDSDFSVIAAAVKSK